MDLYKIKKNTLEPIERDPFKLEREIQSVVETNVETLFGLEFVKTEFSIGKFRLDSICFDNDTNSFVIIEYKKGSSYSVIDQGYSYLSLMLNNKSDFILEYNETTNKSLKRGDVDWSQSRIIFVSPSFNTYQKNSVNFKDVPFELWEIKRFSNGLIGLDQHMSSSEESIEVVEGNKNSVIKDVGKEVKVYTENSFFENKDESIKELYIQLKERVLGWDGSTIDCDKRTIRLKNNKKIKIYITVQKTCLKITFLSRIDFKGNVKSIKKRFILDDPKKMFELGGNNYRDIYTYKLKNDKGLDYVVMMLKQKFDS